MTLAFTAPLNVGSLRSALQRYKPFRFHSYSYRLPSSRMLSSTNSNSNNSNKRDISHLDEETPEEDASHAEETHPHVTLAQLANHSLTLKRKDIAENQKCSQCFLSLTFCICRPVRDIFANHTSTHTASSAHLRNARFRVFMHYKEWGRASNTGKLLPVALPHSSSISLFGVQEEQEALNEALTTQPSLILYPSANARPISEYRDWFHENEGYVNLCMIDSTWPQSHAMEKSLLESVPRVKIDEMVFGPSKFFNRKQSKNKNKVSTIESVIMALSALGWTEEDLLPFNKSFEYAVDAVLMQCNKKTVYGSVITPNFTRADGAEVVGPRQKPSVVKPQCCLRCGASGTGVHFKNLGVRVKKDPAERRAHELDYHELFHTVNPELLERMVQIMSKNTFRVWRCSSCGECFPGEEYRDVSSSPTLEQD